MDQTVGISTGNLESNVHVLSSSYWRKREPARRHSHGVRWRWTREANRTASVAFESCLSKRNLYLTAFSAANGEEDAISTSSSSSPGIKLYSSFCSVTLEYEALSEDRKLSPAAFSSSVSHYLSADTPFLSPSDLNAM
jgi:hypothetical protein